MCIRDSVLSTNEFVVNLATKKLKTQVNQTSIDAPHGIDEFNVFNLKKRKSRIVTPPLIAESPVNLECKLFKKIDLKTKVKNQNIMIIGEVVGIHIDDKFIKKGRIDSVAMRAISRMGYAEYSEIYSKFFMERLNWKY